MKFKSTLLAFLLSITSMVANLKGWRHGGIGRHDRLLLNKLQQFFNGKHESLQNS